MVSAAAVLVAICGVGWVVLKTGNTPPPDPNAVYTPGVAATPARDHLSLVTDSLARFVSQTRGLSFTQPVPATAVSPKTFDAQLRALPANAPDRSPVSSRLPTLIALGLLPDGFSPPAADPHAVLSFYDPASHTIAVRGTSTSTAVQASLVASLTEALDDQHFNLSRLPTGADDVALAARAVVLGDAAAIADRWASATPGARALQPVGVAAAGDGPFPADHWRGYDSFPTVAGARFVTAVEYAGGFPELDRALQSPPASTQQVIDPTAYRDNRVPHPLPVPAADGRPVDQGVIGGYDLVYLFLSVGDVDAAERAAAQWAGGRYVTWQGRSGPCTRFVVVATGGGALLRASLIAWAADAPGRSVAGTGPVQVTACG